MEMDHSVWESTLGPLLFTICVHDYETITNTFAEDTKILTSGKGMDVLIEDINAASQM